MYSITGSLPPGQTAGWQETHHYRNEVLLDNWNEERFDKQWVNRPKPLPSDNAHSYSTTYGQCFNAKKVPCQQAIDNGGERVQRAYPYHQRELDTPGMKRQVDLFQSESRTEYIDPRLRVNPMPMRK